MAATLSLVALSCFHDSYSSNMFHQTSFKDGLGTCKKLSMDEIYWILLVSFGFEG